MTTTQKINTVFNVVERRFWKKKDSVNFQLNPILPAYQLFYILRQINRAENPQNLQKTIGGKLLLWCRKYRINFTG
jgi:hypothetical protein